MRRLSAFLVALMGAVLSAFVCGSAGASAYDAKPKLVVILVIDQFRGDYLDRYRADFKTEDGFNLFLKKGAYFPNCYYEYANTETAPGHSTIGTGAYSNGHNIANNQWWDLSRTTTHPVSSVEDADYPLVGASSDAALGASPRNLLASTIGDEVVLSTHWESKLYGVSLKDRAAILTSGHASAGAFWIDHDTGKFESSTYWGTELPEWVNKFNGSGRIEQARKESAAADGSFYDKVGGSPAAVSYELDFVRALVEGESLGRHDVTDVLTVSLSSTDILGHQVGPDAPEQRAMIDAIDVDLDGFFRWLGAHVDGGLDNVWVAMTGDHGIPSTPATAAAEGMPASAFSPAAVVEELNKELNARLAPAKTLKFVLPASLPFMQLDEQAFAQVEMKEAEAEALVAKLLPGALDATQADLLKAPPNPRGIRPAMVRRVYTKAQLAASDVPATEEGKLMLDSYTTNGGWWVMVSFGMYQIPGSPNGGTTHFSPYSYDRHVPLAFFGGPFVPGTYLEHAEPVDIAATFAALLRVNRPTACVGRVVSEAIKAEDGGAKVVQPHP